MKVLLVNGSPHETGNTYQTLRIIGSPVYFAGPNGALCAVLDRVSYAAAEHGRSFAHKPAAAVVNCYRAGATAALARLNKHFAFSEMPVVSSSYWNMVVDPHPDRVDRDKYGQEILRALAVDMSFLLHRIKDQQE